MKKVVIIGNGISGITAARHIRKKTNYSIAVISAETQHFFSRTALMYIYMGHMKYEHTKPYEDWFWEKNKIELIKDFVTEVNPSDKSLNLQSGSRINYDILVLATGSLPNKFGWSGQDLSGVQGLYSYQDLKNMEKYTKGISRAVIVGGGLIGIEMAEMLLSRNIEVTFLVREEGFWNMVLPVEESEMINRHILEHTVNLKLNTELKEIIPDESGSVRSVITNHGDEILCQFVGLTVGVRPNIEFLKSSEIKTDKGILVNEYFETNIEDIYAIGDCAQFIHPPQGRKAIEQVWYTGRMHGETVAATICGERKAYNPGIWFNSAKFFDIEYQVYGNIPVDYNENVDSIFWKDESNKKSIRIAFEKETRKVIGFNLMGIRYRHKECANWIKNKTDLKEVMSGLKNANFDPEFFKQIEDELLQIYNKKFPKESVYSTSKRGLLALFQ